MLLPDYVTQSHFDFINKPALSLPADSTVGCSPMLFTASCQRKCASFLRINEQPQCGCYACYDWICFHNGQNSNLALQNDSKRELTVVHELQLYGHCYDSLTWSLIHSCTHSILFGIRKGVSLLLVDLQPAFFFLL